MKLLATPAAAAPEPDHRPEVYLLGREGDFVGDRLMRRVLVPTLPWVAAGARPAGLHDRHL